LSGSIPPTLGNLGGLQFLHLFDNLLSGSIPPELANITNLIEMDLENNHFTFDGMELIAQTFPFAHYDKQKRIALDETNNTLSVSAGGTLNNNTYRWFRCDNDSTTIVATIKGDSVFHPMQSGTYYVKIANSVATQLILRSHTISYVAPPLIASSNNALQATDKTGLFLVYPNPVKDLLYVKTNFKASVSFLDQNGKILLTREINGTGNIDVSGMPAGLYYVKNNNNGTVRKILITR
jgi:hypothetical protein